MKRIEVKLNLEMVAPLLDVLKAAADELEPRLALGIQGPDDDQELKDTWTSELLSGQNSDIKAMMGMFDHDFFVTGTIAFDPTNCEPNLRACSALRLWLKETYLKLLGDENLESNEVPYAAMPPEQQKAFAAYVFLATLQELLIHHLDPNVMED
jgi:hypothetical protein